MQNWGAKPASQGHCKATARPVDSQGIATPRPPQWVTNAPTKHQQGSYKATPERRQNAEWRAPDNAQRLGVRWSSLHLIRILSGGGGLSSVRSAMFIVTPTLEARPSSFRSGIEWHFASHSPPVVEPSARCHAAPLELGGPSGICGYKHGAPKGAFCRVAVASPPLNRHGLAFRIFRARPAPYGTTERPVVLQSQRDCVLQPRVAESARLPWEECFVAANPNGVAASGEARWSQPLWGWGLRAMFTQGSSRLATLGFETESLWDSSLEFPKGIRSIPSVVSLK